MSDVEEATDYVDGGGEEDTSVKDTASTASSRRPFTLFGICDMRIGCIFINSFNISMIIVGVLVTGIRDNMFWKSMGAAFAAGVPGLVLSSIGLYGAKTFELWAMYLATAGFIVALIMDAVLLSWVGFFVTAVVVFPHIVLTYEIREGVLTKNNYSQEEYLHDSGREFVDQAHAYIAPTTTGTGTATATDADNTEK
jgi:hypothetical protein